MIESISVSLSGPAFSFLLYENVKSVFRQEGFLLGEIVQKETRTITDNDQRQINITKVIKINSVLPTPLPNYFYNGVGKIDKTKIEGVLGNQKSKVVAWYRYEPTSNFRVSFREKLIHKQLSDYFDIPSDLFSLCLLITECSNNKSTHMYQQTFLRYKNYKYEPLPLHIINLSESINTYKSLEPSSETFDEIIRNLRINPKKTQGLNFIMRVQQALQKHIVKVVDDLTKAEEKLFGLEEDVRKIYELEQINSNLLNDSDNTVESLENGSFDLITFSEPSSRETTPEAIRKNWTKGQGAKNKGKETKQGKKLLRGERVTHAV